MDTLPEELLVSILESLYHEDFSSFYNLMQCTQKLFRIGTPIRFTHVCVRGTRQTSLIAPIDMCMQLEQSKRRLQSLTITNIATTSNTPAEMFRSLRHALVNCSNLNTFSLNHTAGTSALDSGDYGYARHNMELMLESLPSTVVNLELMLNNVGDRMLGGHMCDILTMLILRLETLRLQLPELCCGLFHSIQTSGSVSQLRHAAIWLSRQTTHRHTDPRDLEYSELHQVNTPARDCVFPPGTQTYGRTVSLGASPFAKSVRKLYVEGHFPYLRHFCIIQEYKAHPIYMEWQVREIVSNSTLTVPCESPPRRDDRKYFTAIRGNRGQNRPVTRDQLTYLIEPAIWTTLLTGSRVLRPCDTSTEFDDMWQEPHPRDPSTSPEAGGARLCPGV
jgi:hypothetical protein